MQRFRSIQPLPARAHEPRACVRYGIFASARVDPPAARGLLLCLACIRGTQASRQASWCPCWVACRHYLFLLKDTPARCSRRGWDALFFASMLRCSYLCAGLVSAFSWFLSSGGVRSLLALLCSWITLLSCLYMYLPGF